MEQRQYLKDFIRYASLNVLGMVALSCYILADTFFVSQGLGANGLAALNLAIPVYNFIHGSGLMLGMGGAIKYSVYRSQGNFRKTDAVFTNTVTLALGFALCFVCAGLFLSGTDRGPSGGGCGSVFHDQYLSEGASAVFTGVSDE